MKTALSVLTKENERLEASLEQEDSEILKRAMRFFSGYPLSSMDVQIIRKDLIGMAQEARLRGECMQDMIGAELEAFCEAVLESSRKDKAEYRARTLFEWLRCLLVWYLADWGLFQSFPEMYGLNAAWIPVAAAAFACWLPVNRYFEKKFLIAGGGKAEALLEAANLLSIIVLLMGFGIIPKILFTGSFPQTTLFYVEGWIPMAALTLGTAIAYFLRWLRRNKKGLYQNGF